jgi:hypothetical protein
MQWIVRPLAPALAVIIAVSAPVRADEEPVSSSADFAGAASPFAGGGMDVDFGTGASPLRDQGAEVQFDGRTAWDDLRDISPEGRARAPSRRKAPRAGLAATQLRTGTRCDATVLRGLGLLPLEAARDALLFGTPASDDSALQGTMLLADRPVALGYEGVVSALAVDARELAVSSATLAGLSALRVDVRTAQSSVSTWYVAGAGREIELRVQTTEPLTPDQAAALAGAVHVPRTFEVVPSPAEGRLAELVAGLRLARLPSVDLAVLPELGYVERPEMAKELLRRFGRAAGSYARFFGSAAVKQEEGIAVMLLFDPRASNLRSQLADLAAGKMNGVASRGRVAGLDGVAADVPFQSAWFISAPVSESYMLTVIVVGRAAWDADLRARLLAAVKVPEWLRPERHPTDALVSSMVDFGRRTGVAPALVAPPRAAAPVAEARPAPPASQGPASELPADF